MKRNSHWQRYLGSLALALAALWSVAALVVGLGLVEGGAPGLDLREPQRLLGLALPLAAASYVLRLARFHRLAMRVAPGLRWPEGFLMQAAAFGLTVTPARLGEAAKLAALEQRTGVPLARTAPVMIVERVTEGASFVTLALVGGFALGSLGHTGLTGGALPVVGLLGGLAAVGLLMRSARLRQGLVGWIRRWLPASSRPGRWLHDFGQGSWRLISPWALAEALALSLAARGCDALALWAVAQAVGLSLSPLVALIVLGSAGTVGGLSLLPGGVGAVETSMSGLLLAFGAAVPLAISTTFLIRILMLWLWVGLGLVIIAGQRLVAHRGNHLRSSCVPTEVGGER